MANKDQHIDYDLLAKYLAGECSDEEIQTVRSLLDSNAEVRKIVENGDKLFQPIPENKSKKEPVFNTEKAWESVRSRMDVAGIETKTIPSKQRFIGFAWRVAAILIMGISITLFFYLNQSKEVQYSVAQNETSEFYLPDSTKVVLKDNSSLIAKQDFNKKIRTVSLTGLAYFNVTKNPEKPFIIHMNGATVEVLGTSFLIDTKKVAEISITVESGTVRFASSEKPELASIVLQKNETATLTLDDVKITKEEVLNLNGLYWANKKLTYRQQSLPLVFNELEEIFQKEIIYDAAVIDNCKLSAVFKDETFENIINHISISMDFTYEIIDGNYLITSNGCTKN